MIKDLLTNHNWIGRPSWWMVWIGLVCFSAALVFYISLGHPDLFFWGVVGGFLWWQGVALRSWWYQYQVMRALKKNNLLMEFDNRDRNT